jgi:hypothetical protein
MKPHHRTLLILALFIGTTSFVYAAGLVPCGGTNEPMCRACDFVSMGQKVLFKFIELSAGIIALAFAYGGMKMLMSAGNTGAVSEAKEIMTNAVIGFVILLGAWLIVNTVLMTMMSDGKGIEVWGTIECVSNPAMSGGSTTNPTGGVTTNPGGGGVTNVPFDKFGLTTSQSDASLQTNYTNVDSKYAPQISQACQGSSIPNCSQVVTALIANESQGDPNAGSPKGAQGIMQLLQSNGGSKCAANDPSCIQNQINLGVQKLNSSYTSNAVGQNIPNMLASYNAGQATGEGQSASGMRPALAASVDCPGLLAYQCTTNPGGLIETQHYVANICRTLTIKGSGCN